MRLDVACSNIVDCEHKTAPIDEAGEYFAVGTPAMRDDRINYAEARRISRETFEAWTRRLSPRAGDLLFAREAPVGPVVRLPDVANVAPGQRTVLLRPDPNVVHSAFLYYALTAPAARAGLIVKAEGSTVHHLNVPDIRSFEVWVPSRPEQQAIVEVLGALDDKIAANTALAKTAWALMETSFRAIQADPNRVRVALGAIASLEYGKALPAGTREPGDVAVVGSGGISGTHSLALVHQSGVVVGRKGSAGAVHWVSGPHFPIDTTFYVRGQREAISQSYLYFLLRTLHLDEMNNDSAVPGLNRAEALALPVELAADEHLSAFTSRADALIELVDGVAAQSRTLAATRDALLPQLMSGKLRVHDAENLIDQAGV